MSASEQVDINALSLMNEVVEVDGEIPADWFKLDLPDDGRYRAVIKLIAGSAQRASIEVAREQTVEDKEKKRGFKEYSGKPYLKVNAVFTLLDANGQETRLSVFKDFFDTRIEERKGVRSSPVHAAFALAGHPLHEARSLGELKLAIEQACAQRPVIGLVSQWSADAKKPGAGGKDEYVRGVLKGQRNFPPIAGSDPVKYETEGVTREGWPWKAQARIVEFVSPETI